jgi:ribonuclease HI
VFVDSDQNVIKSLSAAIGPQTNNIAEYCALVMALQEALMLGVTELDVFTDSELVAKQWSGEYKLKEATLKPYQILAKHMASHFKKFSLKHIPRERNKLADEAANQALDNPAFFA